MRQFVLILICWSLVAISCDPCNECGEPLNYEPTVALTLINQDSITALDTLIAETTDIVEGYQSISTEINNRLDSLEDEAERMNDSIQSGNTGYEDSLDLVTDEIEIAEVELLPVQTILNELDSVVDVYSDVRSLINSGRIFIETVAILNNGALIQFEDSMEVFNLPVLMDQNQTNYEITVADETFRFSITYQLQETLSDARVFKVIATEIVLQENYTFDTLIVTCPDDICISNETSLTAYF